jgi:hypothetical protein
LVLGKSSGVGVSKAVLVFALERGEAESCMCWCVGNAPRSENHRHLFPFAPFAFFAPLR